MAVKAQFDSETNFDGFMEQIDYRYPTSNLEVDKIDLTVTFNGDAPDFQVEQLVKGYGGWFDGD